MSKSHCVSLVAAIFCLVGPNAPASDTETFGVDSYIPVKFTDLTWKLDGGLGLSGDRNEETDVDSESSRYDRHYSSDNDSRRLSFATYTEYDYVTIPRHLNVSLEISGYGNASSRESATDHEDTLSVSHDYVGDTDRSNYGLGISPSVNAGQYLVSDLFVSASTNYSYEYYGSPEDRYNTLESSYQVDDSGWVFPSVYERRSVTRSDTKDHSLNAEISGGWGRIYDGHYAATAMNVVSELRNSGLIDREPKNDEMLALTELIYQYREEHAIDTRLHRIEALDTVIRYLSERGIIADPGPYGHLLIEDVWDYFGDRELRSFGWTVTAGVSLDYSKHKHQSGSDSDRYRLRTRHHPDSSGAVDTLEYYDTTLHYSSNRTDISNSPAFVVRARYSKPLNLKWQLDVFAGGKFYFDAYKSRFRDGDEDRTDYTYYEDIYCTVSARYIYDMRTSVTLAAGYDAPIRRTVARVRGEGPGPDFELPRNESSWGLNLLAGMTYRISIPTTLTCKLSWSKEETDWMNFPTQDDESRYSLSVGISHWLY